MSDEFTASDAHRFGGEARRVIALARVLGWSARWGGTAHRMVVLSSPDHAKRINVPTTNINHNRAKSWIKQIMTHTGPEIIDAVMHGKHDMTDPDMAEIVATLGTSMVTFAGKQIEKERDEMASAARQSEAEKATLTVHPKRVAHSHPYVVSRKGKSVDSDAVLVRTWTDGSVDYQCRVCHDYTSERVQSVVMHNTSKHIVPMKDRAPQGGAKGKTKTVKVAPHRPVPRVPADVLAIVNGKAPLAAALDEFVALAPRMREVAESIRGLEEERDSWRARAEKAEGDLSALRDLLATA